MEINRSNWFNWFNYLCRRSFRRRLLAWLALITLTSVITLSHWSIAQAFDPTVAMIAQSPNASPESLVEQGQQRYQMGDYAAAAQLWENAAAEFGAIGDLFQQSQSLNYAAQAYEALGNWSASEGAITANLALWDEDSTTLSPAHLQVLGQAWTIQGSLLLEQSQPQAALATFEQATESYQAADDETGLLRSQINQAKALQAHGFYRRAIELLEGTQPLLIDQAPSLLAAAGLRTLGSLKRTVGDFSAAETLLKRSLQIAEQLGDEDAIAAAQFGLANIAAASDRTDEAQTLYEQIFSSNVAPTQTVKAGGAWLSLLVELENVGAIDSILPRLTSTLAELSLSRIRT